jgi:hypothetical protein
VEVGCAVSMIVDPDCVIVKVGGLPVASGPRVAEPAAGVVAVAPPEGEPPITDCTGAGIAYPQDAWNIEDPWLTAKDPAGVESEVKELVHWREEALKT